MTGGQTPSIPHAPLSRRVMAGLVDLAIWASLGATLSAALISQTGTTGDRRWFAGYLTVFVTGWLYFAVLESSARRASIGKMLLGLAVIDLRGRPISFGRASLRHWGRTVSALPVFGGFVMAAFNEQQQAFHDWVADCRVVPRDAVAGAGAHASPQAPASSASRPPAPASAVPLVVAPVTAAPSRAPEPVSRPVAAGPAVDETVRESAVAKTVLVSAQKGWALKVVAGPDVGKRYPLGVEGRIGRDPACSIHLNDETASRSHALIVQTPAGFVLRDLGSANSTLVEGRAITEPHTLRPGEAITIGSTKLVLESPDAR